MTRILTWIKSNKLVVILSVILIILLLLNLKQCNSAKVAQKKLEVAEHNIAALNDTIRVSKTKDNKPEFDKLAFLTDKISNLEKLSATLAKEVKATKGKVSSLISGNIEIVHDTVEVWTNTVLDDEKVISEFKLDTTYSEGNSRKIEGYTEYYWETESSAGYITKDSLSLSFVTGIKNLDKGKPEIFLRSDYPGFRATRLEGAVLDPKLFQPKNKQRLLTLGLNVGYTPITYSLGTQKLSFDPIRFGASVGLNINLNRLLSKK